MKAQDRLTVIAMSDLFQDIPWAVVHQLGEVAVEEVSAGVIVREQGETMTRIRLLVEGKMAVSAVVNGLEVIVEMLEPGAWTNLSALTDSKVSGSRVRAVRDSVLLSLDADRVKQVLIKEPEAGVRVMIRVAQSIEDRYRALAEAMRRNLEREWESLETRSQTA
ncbi:MAG: cyclic nucleotide-binding domain-containing protein [Chloroflexi bacterium]|nr:cyclic nucleotide-binding domain-containing protein [Chloroflexota bacterium]